MAITVKQNLVPKSKYGIKAPYPMDAEYITYHNTANDATAEGEVGYMIGNNNEVSYHYAVDEDSVVQGVPVNRTAWHCGDGKNGTGNRKSIGVEVCYSKSGGEKYKKAEALANKFIAQLLHERGWNVDRVKQHNHWSGKNCPHRIRDEKRWNAVIADIQKQLDILKGGSKNPTPSKPAPTTPKGYLEKGDKGAQIKELQTLLEKAGYVVGSIDGIFGDATDKAVRKFQKDHKLSVDGLAGNGTMQVLEAITSKPAPVKPSKPVEKPKPTAPSKPAELGSNVFGTIKVLASELNVREKADLKSKVAKVVKKGESLKVYAQKNGLYQLGANQYCTSNVKYVSFTKNPKYGVVAKTKTVTVLASELFTYKTADWDNKGAVVKKGDVFTIAKELTVAGSKMYQLKSGLFISANPKYVKVTVK